MQRLLFAFLASLVETNIKISLFFMDTHQGLEGRRSLITCWKMEGSQCGIVKMLAIISQVRWSAQHTWTGIECFPVTNFTEMESDAGQESECQRQPAPPDCESFQDRDLILHSLLCLKHLALEKSWTMLNGWVNELINGWARFSVFFIS